MPWPDGEPRRRHAHVKGLLVELCLVADCWQDLVGVSAVARGRRLARRLELLTLPVFQLVPHALIAVSVMAHPEAFSSRV